MDIKLRRRDLIFVVAAFAFSLIVNRTLFLAPQIAMTDTEPPPYPIWVPPLPAGMADLAWNSFSHEALVLLLTPKWDTVLFYVLSIAALVLSGHYFARQFQFRDEKQIMRDLRLYVFPFLLAVNPAVVTSFLSGDAGGVNLSFAVAIFELAVLYKYAETGSRRYLAYVIVLSLVGGWVYFEYFFISFFFSIPIFAYYGVKGRTAELRRSLLASIMSSVLSFFSEMNVAVLAYFTAKAAAPSIFVSTVGYYTSNVNFYLIVLLSLIALTILVRQELPRAFFFTSFLFLSAYTAFYFHGIPVPLLDAVWATFTGMSIKFAMFLETLFSLALLSARNGEAVTLLALLAIFLPYSSWNTPGTNHYGDLYELLSFNALQFAHIPGLYQVAEKIAESPGPSIAVLYGYKDYIQVQTAIPWVQGYVYFGDLSNTVNYSSLKVSGIKYVISEIPLNYSYLKLEGQYGSLYLYQFEGFDGIAHALDGRPVNYTIKGDEIVLSSAPAVVAIPYSPYLTNAKPYLFGTLINSTTSTYVIYPIYQASVYAAIVAWLIGVTSALWLLLPRSPPSRLSATTSRRR